MREIQRKRERREKESNKDTQDTENGSEVKRICREADGGRADVRGRGQREDGDHFAFRHPARVLATSQHPHIPEAMSSSYGMELLRRQLIGAAALTDYLTLPSLSFLPSLLLPPVLS
jgi:hypothetical protein